MLVDVGDTRLHVTERGTGELPLFVLHGGPGLDHTMFGSYLDALGDLCRLLLVDERATGRSDPSPPETWTLERQAADRQLDHRVPCFLGGTTAGRNIWPEAG